MASDLRTLGEQTYSAGRNVIATLREEIGAEINTPEIIEIAYDLQAGTYAQHAERNSAFLERYAGQLANYLRPHLQDGDTLMDAGTGEVTTLSHLIPRLRIDLARIHAFDISQRRLDVGHEYALKHMGPLADRLHLFKAELSSIPLRDKSVDVVTSNHALEPNGGREIEMLTELARVAKRKLVLFEPCREIAGQSARDRMKQHGYINALADAAKRVGLTVESVRPLQIVQNPMNPTACFVFVPQ